MKPISGFEIKKFEFKVTYAMVCGKKHPVVTPWARHQTCKTFSYKKRKLCFNGTLKDMVMNFSHTTSKSPLSLLSWLTNIFSKLMLFSEKLNKGTPFFFFFFFFFLKCPVCKHLSHDVRRDLGFFSFQTWPHFVIPYHYSTD